MAPRVKVEIRNDALGGWVVTPVNKRLQEALRQHCEDMSEAGCPPWCGYICLNFESSIDDFARHAGFFGRQRGEINNGWTVSKMIDAEYFLKLIGWDAEHVVW